MIDRRALPFVAVLVIFASTAPRMWGGREPYPAILMPGFAFPTADGGVRSKEWPEITVVLLDGDEMTLSARRLLGPLPSSQVETTLEGFRPAGSVPADGRDVSRLPSFPVLDRLLPGLRIRREYEAAGHRFASDASREWLRRKVERLAGGRPVRELRFEWFEETLRRGEASPVRARALGTFVVEFDR